MNKLSSRARQAAQLVDESLQLRLMPSLAMVKLIPSLLVVSVGGQNRHKRNTESDATMMIPSPILAGCASPRTARCIGTLGWFAWCVVEEWKVVRKHFMCEVKEGHLHDVVFHFTRIVGCWDPSGL